MKKSGNGSYMIKALVFVGALVVLAMSTTYAYYALNISGESEKTNLVAAKLDIDTDLTKEKAGISDLKLSLINENEKATKADKVEFYIQNNSTTGVDALYYVYLKDVTLTDNFKSADFKWELVKKKSDGSSEEVINSGDFSNVTGSPTTVPIPKNGSEEEKKATHTESYSLNKNKTDAPTDLEGFRLTNNTKDELIFRIWLQNNPDTNQATLLNGSFTAKLYFEAIPTK